MMELTELEHQALDALLDGARASRQNLFALRRINGEFRYDFPAFTAAGTLPVDAVMGLEAQGHIELRAVDARSFRARITEEALVSRGGRRVEIYEL